MISYTGILVHQIRKGWNEMTGEETSEMKFKELSDEEIKEAVWQAHCKLMGRDQAIARKAEAYRTEQFVRFLQFEADAFRMSASGDYEIRLTNAQWHFLKKQAEEADFRKVKRE